MGRQLAPPTETQHAPAVRAREAPRSQSSHHQSSHKRRGPERERERDRAFKRPRGGLSMLGIAAMVLEGHEVCSCLLGHLLHKLWDRERMCKRWLGGLQH